MFLSRPYSKEHDVGEELYNIRNILNQHGNDDKKIAILVKESKTLAQWRETSFYGDEKLKVGGIFNEKDAEIALSYAENISIICEILKMKIFKKIS